VPARYPVGPAKGYTPADLATAYGFNPKHGAGQTIGIVDAFDDPNIVTDLDAFDLQYGLAPETATSFVKVGQTGSTTALPAADTTGWSVEESLDVETARGVCNGCKILLVEVKNTSATAFLGGVKTAVRLGATEVSNSYGGPENPSWSKKRRATYEAGYHYPGVVITASTGDDGWFTWDLANAGVPSANAPNIPATLPTVVAVGGTTLTLKANGTRKAESVWNENGLVDGFGLHKGGPQGATGGGCSRLYTARGWQSHVSGYAKTGCGTSRLAADVSALADPDTGFDVDATYDCGKPCQPVGWQTLGGTSLSSPLIAAMWALAGGADGVKLPALSLYGHSIAAKPHRYDVKIGGNSWCDKDRTCAADTKHEHLGENPNGLGNVQTGQALRLLDCAFTHAGKPVKDDTQCNAAKGYDGPSGVGTPIGLTMFKPMSPTVRIHRPASLHAKAAEKFAGGGTDPFPGGKISSYVWVWGDGTHKSHGPSPSHSYAKPGRYVMSLTETDNYGRVATRTVTVIVHNAKPVKKK
jgi:PKD domain/Subtilase family